MKTVTVQNFHSGIADDIYNSNIGEFSIAKHFDILTYPKRLQPFRGMTSDTASTLIGNLMMASSGSIYGSGSVSGVGRLFVRSGYGASDGYGDVPNLSQSSGVAIVYPFLVEFTNSKTVRTIYWAGTNTIVNSDPAGGSSANTQTLNFTSIGQGFVHPKDQILYVPYNDANNIPRIGTITSASETINGAVFTLPSQYQIPCLTNYGNYLAIPAYVAKGNTPNSSIVYLSDRDSSLTTFTESIKWGAGTLQVLNNLDGVLIGVSAISSLDGTQNQDSASIVIKGYNGGTDPFVIKEIRANHLAASSHPSATINPNVNFIYKDRLYFSVNINPNDGVSNSYYGLWSVGKNKVNGQYTVTMERIATNDNSETGILAAAFNGDFVSMVHSAVGTLTCTINGATSSATYGATSVYESVVNPEMPALDQIYNKSLISVGIQLLPLMSGQQVVMKYRVDSTGSWTTLFTKTSSSPDSNLTTFELPLSGSVGAVSGRNIEFRLESTGGAIITGYSYKYEILKSNL